MDCGSVRWSGPGYQVYAINPKAVSRYRDCHRLGGAKSDRADAKLLADVVRTDRGGAGEHHEGTEPPDQQDRSDPRYPF